MKFFFISLFFLVIASNAYSQIDLKSQLEKGKSVPDNWVSILSNSSHWDIINSAFIGNESRKFYPMNPAWKLKNDSIGNYQFTLNSVSTSWKMIDSLKDFSARYFPVERTFYISYSFNAGDKFLIQKIPYQVYYLDSTYLIIEHLDMTYFDYETGKVLSEKELKEKSQETREKAVITSSSNQSIYNVRDHSKKKSRKTEEYLRLVQLLKSK